MKKRLRQRRVNNSTVQSPDRVRVYVVVVVFFVARSHSRLYKEIATRRVYKVLRVLSTICFNHSSRYTYCSTPDSCCCCRFVHSQ